MTRDPMDLLTNELAITLRQLVRDLDSYMIRCRAMGIEPSKALVNAHQGWIKVLADYDGDDLTS